MLKLLTLGLLAATLIVAAGGSKAAWLEAVERNAPRKIVETRSPTIGVHTRLTDEVEEWKIKRTLELVREMGASWIVEYFPWPYIQPAPGRYDWRHSDLVVKHAYSEGLNLVARIDGVPEWARPKETTGRYLPEERFYDYARFVQAFVARYKDKVRYFIVWNEPNLGFEWGYRPVNAEQYTRLLAMTYRLVKEVDPDARVVAAGLAPTLEQSDLALNDLVYLQQMYDAGARDYFDVLAVHAYGGKLPPDDEPAVDRLNFARATLIHDVMARNGDGQKPVIISEAGWNDHPRWTKAVRPGQRLVYTVRAYEKAAAEWPWVLAVAQWAFRLPAPAGNYNDYYTFVRPDFAVKPVYEAVKQWARPR
jgi:hypothetical protein